MIAFEWPLGANGDLAKGMPKQHRNSVRRKAAGLHCKVEADEELKARDHAVDQGDGAAPSSLC